MIYSLQVLFYKFKLIGKKRRKVSHANSVSLRSNVIINDNKKVVIRGLTSAQHSSLKWQFQMLSTYLVLPLSIGSTFCLHLTSSRSIKQLNVLWLIKWRIFMLNWFLDSIYHPHLEYCQSFMTFQCSLVSCLCQLTFHSHLSLIVRWLDSKIPINLILFLMHTLRKDKQVF